MNMATLTGRDLRIKKMHNGARRIEAIIAETILGSRCLLFHHMYYMTRGILIDNLSMLLLQLWVFVQHRNSDNT